MATRRRCSRPLPRSEPLTAAATATRRPDCRQTPGLAASRRRGSGARPALLLASNARTPELRSRLVRTPTPALRALILGAGATVGVVLVALAAGAPRLSDGGKLLDNFPGLGKSLQPVIKKLTRISTASPTVTAAAPALKPPPSAGCGQHLRARRCSASPSSLAIIWFLIILARPPRGLVGVAVAAGGPRGRGARGGARSPPSRGRRADRRRPDADDRVARRGRWRRCRATPVLRLLAAASKRRSDASGWRAQTASRSPRRSSRPESSPSTTSTARRSPACHGLLIVRPRYAPAPVSEDGPQHGGCGARGLARQAIAPCRRLASDPAFRRRPRSRVCALERQGRAASRSASGSKASSSSASSC